MKNNKQFYIMDEKKQLNDLNSNYLNSKEELSIAGLDFLENIEALSEEKMLNKIETSKIIQKTSESNKEILNQILPAEYAFNLFKKGKEIFDNFYDSQPYIFTQNENDTLFSSIKKIINLSFTLKGTRDIDKFYEFLIYFEQKNSFYNINSFRDDILSSKHKGLYEKCLKHFSFSSKDYLYNILYYHTPEQFEIFLKHTSDFYLTYGKEKGELGFGNVAFVYKNINKYIDVLKSKFKDKPEYNEKEWLLDIFKHEQFQYAIQGFSNFPIESQTFIHAILIENPEFLTQQITWQNSQKTKTLAEHLKQTNIQPLVDIVVKCENH